MGRDGEIELAERYAGAGLPQQRARRGGAFRGHLYWISWYHWCAPVSLIRIESYNEVKVDEVAGHRLSIERKGQPTVAGN